MDGRFTRPAGFACWPGGAFNRNTDMQIECLIQRAGGSLIEIGGAVYHFRPKAGDDRHVAEVADDDHIQTLLAIKEGYRIAKPLAPPAPKKPAPSAPPAQTADPAK